MYSVRTYQQRLSQLGFNPGPIDGIYGRRTKRAVKAFQQHMKIQVDGVVGPQTWGKLFPKVEEDTSTHISHSHLPWMDEALKVRGLHEVRNRKELFNWLRSDGSSVGDPSKIPWCGDFVETSIKISLPNEKFEGKLLENPYWARNWALFGRQTEARYGAILVFVRKGGGHVGFYVGEDKNYYHVLGGNQSNSVTVSRISKKRCIGIRWPKTVPIPRDKVKVTMSNNGKLSISTNEE